MLFSFLAVKRNCELFENVKELQKLRLAENGGIMERRKFLIGQQKFGCTLRHLIFGTLFERYTKSCIIKSLGEESNFKEISMERRFL